MFLGRDAERLEEKWVRFGVDYGMGVTVMYDPCEKCRIYGDDYSYDKDGDKVVRCKDCENNPKHSWSGCPMTHLIKKHRPESVWCLKG